jgi:membrane-associated phospholipid phosphatase
MAQGARRWVVGAVAVVAGLAVAVAWHPGPFPGEVGYVRALQRLGEPVPTLADGVRLLTSTEATLVWMLPTLVVVRRHGRAGIVALAIALGAMLVVQPLFKEVVDRPRPSVAQVDVRAEYDSRSFPSGHSLSTTTLWGAAAGYAWSRHRRGLAVAVTVPIVATGLASAVQGVHWPTDVVAGTLTGTVAAAAIAGVLVDRDRIGREPVPRSVTRRSTCPGWWRSGRWASRMARCVRRRCESRCSARSASGTPPGAT